MLIVQRFLRKQCNNCHQIWLWPKWKNNTCLLPNKSSLVALQHVAQKSLIHSTSSHFQSSTSTPCPFKTLKLTKESTYADAKKSFLKIAMANHPDTLANDTEKERNASIERFKTARMALDALIEDESNGRLVLKAGLELMDQVQKDMTDEEFDEWFLDETGKSNPYQFDLDPQTMREVAEATDSLGGGLDRDGGMWTLARMVSNSVKDGKERGGGGANILKLEAGEVADEDENDGRLRRRRRRGGGSGFARR